MAIDIHSRKPYLNRKSGGLSGPAIKPIAVKLVHDVYQSVKIPILGMGGITTYEDVVEFMLAGAHAIAIGTGNFVNPNAPIACLEGLKEYMKCYNMKDLSEIIGKMVE